MTADINELSTKLAETAVKLEVAQEGIKILHDKIDENITYHKKVQQLEHNNNFLMGQIIDGQKRMDKIEANVENIKDSQVMMSKSIISIEGKLDNGLIEQTKENSKVLKELSDIMISTNNNCENHQKQIEKIEPIENFINGFKAVLKVATTVGIVSGASAVIMSILANLIKHFVTI